MINLIGKRFGRLVVIKRVDNNKWGHVRYLCKCDCGKEKIIRGDSLKNGTAKSCGCLQKELTIKRSTRHGYSRNKIYYIWLQMIQRCANPNNPKYNDYGGRGITVCKRWMKFENFLADMGEAPPGLSLDRKNNNKNYCKSNCRWTNGTEQNRNSRNNRLETYNGKTLCIAAWAEEYNISQDTLWTRLYKLNWSIKKALTTPVRKYKKKSK